MKQISLNSIRVILEIYVVKNPTCFSRWSVRINIILKRLNNIELENECDYNKQNENNLAEIEDYEKKKMLKEKYLNRLCFRKELIDMYDNI